ncbi:MAG: glutamine-hydrolyzing carbamoyl-phosphate synthase small subunit [Clostridia bacterium]|nr:glutamine-hydrolyzing carbamoyl-phosphate synthase small subunit [Clostridia bacterium]
MQKRAYLTLASGDVFPGWRLGAECDAVGELVFSTSMCGYLEALTDPGYKGQILMQTFPLIGNYGLIEEDYESDKVHLSAYVVREMCDEPSNFRSTGELESLFKDNGVACIFGVDTRAITRIVRERGVMNAIITSNKELSEEQKKLLNEYKIEKAVEAVTCKEEITLSEGSKRLILWDFGATNSLANEMIKRDCEVIKVPAFTSAERILALKPDGILLSDGPGDPAEYQNIIDEISKLSFRGIPIMGIGFGHQLLALAMGGRTLKLKYGHRGANQAVVYTVTGRSYITSQNHGFAVDAIGLPRGAKLLFFNLNDGTCEGLEYENAQAFSVQFVPEAAGGPQDMSFLYERFIKMMPKGE